MCQVLVKIVAPFRCLPPIFGNKHFFYKQHFHKQRQAEIGKKLSKS